VAKAMTEVRKPGGNSKVASVPYVFQIETETVNHQFYTDILKKKILVFIKSEQFLSAIIRRFLK